MPLSWSRSSGTGRLRRRSCSPPWRPLGQQSPSPQHSGPLATLAISQGAAPELILTAPETQLHRPNSTEPHGCNITPETLSRQPVASEGVYRQPDASAPCHAHCIPASDIEPLGSALHCPASGVCYHSCPDLDAGFEMACRQVAEDSLLLPMDVTDSEPQRCQSEAAAALHTCAWPAHYEHLDKPQKEQDDLNALFGPQQPVLAANQPGCGPNQPVFQSEFGALLFQRSRSDDPGAAAHAQTGSGQPFSTDDNWHTGDCLLQLYLGVYYSEGNPRSFICLFRRHFQLSSD